MHYGKFLHSLKRLSFGQDPTQDAIMQFPRELLSTTITSKYTNNAINPRKKNFKTNSLFFH